MKRHFSAVAATLVIALAGAGSATASAGLLDGGSSQSGIQSVVFGDQSSDQSNSADVTQKQGNGNINISPALSLFGDAKTGNAQGNGNEATAVVDQSNKADQSQQADQQQGLNQDGGGCCGQQVQAAQQDVTHGDQTSTQSNDASVTQNQGNGNINISPAIAIGGDATTYNAQGNGNEATAYVDQGNKADQSQSAKQGQSLDQGGSGSYGGKGGYGKKDECCGGQSQTGQQSIVGGDQTSTQSNDAYVTQKQGNGNINISPAIAIGGNATTHNAQGNGNEATAYVDQSNKADQSQDAAQKQRLDQDGGSCCGGQSQTGQQSIVGGDQTSTQSNDASVTQKQGNDNVNVSPAIVLGGKSHGPKPSDKCRSTCDHGKSGGDATTYNAQGNGNEATAYVDQGNKADQSQSAKQGQSLDQGGSGSYGGKGGYGKKDECCGGQSQTGQQSIVGGDQTSTQSNDASVTQKQGNDNVNRSPAIVPGGTSHGSKPSDKCRSKCDDHGKGGGDAKTYNAQGNGNEAVAVVGQRNKSGQSQDAAQKQRLDQDGGSCCGGQSQTGQQSIVGGDQTSTQSNDASVTQKQGNDNVNRSPAIADGKSHGGKPYGDKCRPKCDDHGKSGGDATTYNAQGNGNKAVAVVGQSNKADQSQSAKQEQGLSQKGSDCCRPDHPKGDHGPKGGECPKGGHGPKGDDCPKGGHGAKGDDGPKGDSGGHGPKGDRCCGAQEQKGDQHAYGGDQTVTQGNTAEITQKQGNDNVNRSPARAFGGDAKTWNAQGNGNEAAAVVGQSNSASQSQTATQYQSLDQLAAWCKGVIGR